MHIKPLIVPVVASDAKHDLVLLKVGANFKRFATFREGAIQKGNSGGPLLDLSGHVIGVVAQSTAELSPADIAECAQLYTALIECWK